MDTNNQWNQNRNINQQSNKDTNQRESSPHEPSIDEKQKKQPKTDPAGGGQQSTRIQDQMSKNRSVDR